MTVHAVVEHHTGSSYSMSEPLLLAVGVQQSTSPSLEVADEEWEDLCKDCGAWEWIDGELDGGAKADGEGKEERNEFGGETFILGRRAMLEIEGTRTDVRVLSRESRHRAT